MYIGHGSEDITMNQFFNDFVIVLTLMNVMDKLHDQSGHSKLAIWINYESNCKAGVSRCNLQTFANMTMTMKYIYLNLTLYIQWIVNIACMKYSKKKYYECSYSKL